MAAVMRPIKTNRIVPRLAEIVHQLAADLDREADLHLSEGRGWIAERLSVRAADMRTGVAT